MTFGLTKDQFNFLNKNVIEPLKNNGFKVYIFGSRVTGKHHSFSDIDILFDGPILQNKILISQIKETMENSNFPFKIDLVHLPDLAKSYMEKILSERVEI